MEKQKAFPGIMGSIFLLLLLHLLMGLVEFLYTIILSFCGMDSRGFSVFATGLFSILSFFGVIILGFKMTGRPVREVFPVKNIDPVFLLYLAITCVGLVIVLSEVDNIFRNNIPIPNHFSDKMKDLLTGNDIISTAILIAVVAPLTEELLFRGIILNGLKKNHNAIAAIFISALLFSLFHGNPLQMTGAFFGGLYLAWILEKTKNILYPIASHSIFNLFPFLILRMTSIQIEGFTDIDGVSKNYQPLWFDFSGIIILISGLFLVDRHMKKYFTHVSPEI